MSTLKPALVQDCNGEEIEVCWGTDGRWIDDGQICIQRFENLIYYIIKTYVKILHLLPFTCAYNNSKCPSTTENHKIMVKFRLRCSVEFDPPPSHSLSGGGT